VPFRKRSYFFTFIAPSGLSPYDSHICCTPWSVLQDGSIKSILSATFTQRGPWNADEALPQVLASQARGEAARHFPKTAPICVAVLSPVQHRHYPSCKTPPRRGYLLGPLLCRPKLLLTCKWQTSPPIATIDSSVSLSAISRTVEPSLQSSFHLSLTVLVRYRSLADI
jgi:hypothetical protein